MSKQSDHQNAVVLLTGGAGFLGKVILENLMRQKKSLDVTKVILLIRPNQKKSALERFKDQVSKAPCFYNLPLKWAQDVEVVSGDLSLPNWGLSVEERRSLAERITHIIHSAASVDFNLPIRDAAEANITSSLSVIDFAKTCTNLESIVCVSTAYVSPHKSGPILEELVQLPFDPVRVYDDIRSGLAKQEELLQRSGHPNTYTLTKCIAEHLVLKNRGSLPLIIVRPSIISAAIKYPFPGWIDSYAALAAFVGVFGAGYLRVVAADPEARLDVIPVDLVAETVVNQAFLVIPDIQKPRIVHAVAGLKNALPIGQLPQHGCEYFGKFTDRRPAYIRKMGPLNSVRYLEHLIYHRAPTKLAKVGALLTGKTKLAQRVGKLDEILNTIFKVFPYFTHRSFDFVQREPLKLDLDMPFYTKLLCEGVHKYLLRESPDRQLLAGKKMDDKSTQTKDSLPRSGAYSALKAEAAIARETITSIFDEVTFDQASFLRALTYCPVGQRILIATSYQSHFDLLLPAFLFYSRSDLEISVPFIASRAISSSPTILGGFLETLQETYFPHAYLQAESDFEAAIKSVVKSRKTLQSFVARDPHLIPASSPSMSDILRYFKESKEGVTIIPMAISYDQIPETVVPLPEAGTHHSELQSSGYADTWLQQLTARRKKLGGVHICCGEPILMQPDSDSDKISQKIAAEIKRVTPISDYQVEAFIHANPSLGLTSESLTATLRRCGATVQSSSSKTISWDSEAIIFEKAGRQQWQHFIEAAYRGHEVRPESKGEVAVPSEGGFGSVLEPQEIVEIQPIYDAL